MSVTSISPGTKPLGIHAKLALLTAQANRVPKNGYNDFQKFRFVTEADVVEAIFPAAAALGLHVACFQKPGSVKTEAIATSQGKSATRATVTIVVRITNCDTPSEVQEFEFEDHADDAADKAIKKASTGAKKYALLLAFGLATGDDPDKGNGVVTPQTAAQKPPAKVDPNGPSTPGQRRIIEELQQTPLGWCDVDAWLDACTDAGVGSTQSLEALTAAQAQRLTKALRAARDRATTVQS